MHASTKMIGDVEKSAAIFFVVKTLIPLQSAKTSGALSTLSVL